MTDSATLSDAPAFAAKLGQRGELRQAVGTSGRVHFDRYLPFIVLHRSASPGRSIARRVAVNSPAYLIWSPEDDALAAQALAAIAAAMSRRFERLLVLTVEDSAWQPARAGSEDLPEFRFRVAASPGERAQGALAALAKALAEIEIDLRQAFVELAGDAGPVDTGASGADVDHLSIAIPQIHRAGDDTFYPQITHELAAACGDALLKAACAFMAKGKTGAPDHYRSLGRSAFLAAALDADRKLDGVARSFDFLLSVSPINTREAMQTFLDGGAQRAPQFRYRPLTVDPDMAKRELYAVDLSKLEDPLLERLLSEKRQEIDHQLTMLATRNSRAFRAASLLHYGTVTTRLLADARAILAAQHPPTPPSRRIGAAEVADTARALVARYQAIDPGFAAEVEVRDDVGSLIVSGGKLMIASNTSMLESRLDPLLAHEVSVHLLTYCNGAAQGLTVFRTGLAQYEGVQEGLGVFAEWAVGGLTAARLRLLAGRVLAVHAMLDGADFVEVFRMLSDDHGIGRRPAFDITARVFRSGGFVKDFIYLEGFQHVIGLVASGASLDPFWIGKIAPGHVSAIEELLQRNLIRPPLFTPEFLGREDVQRRVARLRDGLALQNILDVE
ncbi:tyrosine/phenylalanine carboxypeptidase domain-containing protein [Sphingosinicella sp. YJ22]|uniref:flavohemoglobin expression-modulating QEGLA motif protein n=1 Tax=Sphingosinicella sp. YJ22 TaxID=1104780 RepID=UPI00140DCBD7|nr:tyrosine/phenylalanine carboxypeptidase domain-containing protein [Sphingosinicella sp. YJ22]